MDTNPALQARIVRCTQGRVAARRQRLDKVYQYGLMQAEGEQAWRREQQAQERAAQAAEAEQAARRAEREALRERQQQWDVERGINNWPHDMPPDNDEDS